MLCLPAATLATGDSEAPVYELSISGPELTFAESCDDPCHIERVEVIGEVGMSASTEESDAAADEGELQMGSDCYEANCRKKKKTQLRVSGPRTLREGLEVTIEDRWAHFIFYSVVETKSGPATRRRHHEFRVDRPLIAVTLEDHNVELRATVEQDPDIVRSRSVER